MLPRAHDSFLIRLARPDEDDACTALENAVWAPFQGGTDNGELFLGYRYPRLKPDGLALSSPAGR